MMYEPRTVFSAGTATVPMRVIGPRLAASDPIMRLGDEEIPLDRPTDVELVAKISRGTLPFDENEAQFVSVDLALDQNVFAWWNPFTWWASDPVQREMTLMLLPRVLGSYIIEPKVKTRVVDKSTFNTTAHHKGKDQQINVGVKLSEALYADGWRLDTQAIRNGGVIFRSSEGGGGGACVGPDIPALTPDILPYAIYVQKNGNKDAERFCHITVPMKKESEAIVDGTPIEGQLDWQTDKDATLPEGTDSYTVRVMLYDGTTTVVAEGSPVPYGLVEIDRQPDKIILRPNPPKDF